MTKRKRGRPRSPSADRKAERLEIRLTKAELRLLDRLSTAADMTRGDVMRGLLRREARRKNLV